MPDNRTLQEILEQRSADLERTAETLPQGDAREDLLHRASNMEAASLIIDRWLASPGLRAPTYR